MTKTLSRELTTYEKEVISVIVEIADIIKTDTHACPNYRESVLRLESNILKLKAELNIPNNSKGYHGMFDNDK